MEILADEVHSLLRGDRGAQTLCLIERLSRMAGVQPRRIGLSATIGDTEATARILGAGSMRDTVVPQVKEAGQTWRLSMEHFYSYGPQAAERVTEKRSHGMGATGAPIHVDAIVERIDGYLSNMDETYYIYRRVMKALGFNRNPGER